MRFLSFGVSVFAGLLALSDVCLAHKVAVFAFVDGGEIQVECSFGDSRKVKNGRLVIADPESGAVLLEGTTDERGIFRFRPSDEFLETGHALHIRLLAGEGHAGEWTVSPGELRTLSRASGRENADAAAPGRGTETARQPAVGHPGTNPAPPFPAIDVAGLEAVIGKVVDEKLIPVKQALARQGENDPGLRDVVGGIGWILGLLGLAAYMKYGRRTRHDDNAA